jgi:hypothetical protein
MYYNVSRLPRASDTPSIPLRSDAVTLLHLSANGRATQARTFPEKQAVLAELGSGYTLLAIWARDGQATVYSVDDLTTLRRAFKVYSGTLGRSYRTVPAGLEARREEDAKRFEAKSCRMCKAQAGEPCRTYSGRVAAQYHSGRDGSLDGTARVPKSRRQSK